MQSLHAIGAYVDGPRVGSDLLVLVGLVHVTRMTGSVLEGTQLGITTEDLAGASGPSAGSTVFRRLATVLKEMGAALHLPAVRVSFRIEGKGQTVRAPSYVPMTQVGTPQ